MNLFGWQIPATANDVVQIAVLYFAIYALLKAARGSRFGQVLTGAGILFGLLIAFTFVLHFQVLGHIVRGLLAYLAISSVVIFQPEIRRVLETLGALTSQEDKNRFRIRRRGAPEKFADWTLALAARKTGALVAFERGISLRGHEASGVSLDAEPSLELLLSIFTVPMPLHDGGVIVRNGRIAAAHCLFPVSPQASLSVSGMRHRAAVGLSEETDALVVAVSEETGAVSIAHNGHIKRYPNVQDAETRANVVRWIRKAMPEHRSPVETALEKLWRRFARKRAAANADANQTYGEAQNANADREATT